MFVSFTWFGPDTVPERGRVARPFENVSQDVGGGAAGAPALGALQVVEEVVDQGRPVIPRQAGDRAGRERDVVSFADDHLVRRHRIEKEAPAFRRAECSFIRLDALRRIAQLPLDFVGFHIFSGSQNLRAEAIVGIVTIGLIIVLTGVPVYFLWRKSPST